MSPPVAETQFRQALAMLGCARFETQVDTPKDALRRMQAEVKFR